ncbi:MAG: hypothetical protein CMC86_04160 [Flavobacteriaceae bacterium]|nr:hypothetical protein [Flavobacteriaceae bacterium]|tara:strand:- start:31128 stop:31580 length:453 start_codon:yes stop_codon:yes gene_type:complete
MKKLLLLSFAFTFIACSGGDSDNSDSNNNYNNGNNINDPIIGTWVLVNEEIDGGDWGGSCRGCFMENDDGSPDTFIFTQSDVVKNVWECFPDDGSICTELETYGPGSWENIGSDVYEIDGDQLQVTFIGNDEMQTPFEDGEITQTWSRVD